MSFQIPEELCQPVHHKAHLRRETARTNKRPAQRECVLGLIEEALNEAERQVSVGPCEDRTPGRPQPLEEGETAAGSEEKAV